VRPLCPDTASFDPATSGILAGRPDRPRDLASLDGARAASSTLDWLDGFRATDGIVELAE
jgi:hypothetical protein